MPNKDINNETDKIANTILILTISVLILAIIFTPLLEVHFLVTTKAISGGMVLSIGYYISSSIKSSKQKNESLEEKISFDGT